MNTILKRTLTGSIFVSLIILSLLIHPLAFAIATSLLNFGALYEMRKIGEALAGKSYSGWIYTGSITFLIASVLLALGQPVAYVMVPFLVLFVLFLITPLYIISENGLAGILIPVFSVMYISIPFLILNLIQQSSIRLGIPIALALFIIIWTNDTFAYLSGMAFGRHKIFARISPMKSWEGFFGGTFMGIVASLLFYYLFPSLELHQWLIFAVLVSLASVFGDLFESLLKRKAGIKDSGNILPGHGGILDRIDSVLLVSPVIYIFMILF
jgi:phosphatidate cytidylyltransferase